MSTIKKLIKDFYVECSIMETLALTLVPLLFTVTLFFIISKDFSLSNDQLLTLSLSFIGNMFTVSSILASFGIAAITIIATSGSENINEAKKQIARRNKKDIFDSRGLKITYYQYILTRGFYSILTEITLVLLTLFFIFIINMNSIDIVVSICVLTLFFFHSIFTLVLLTMSLYHLIFK